MFCPKCGATNDDGSKFCQGCGGPLTEAANENAPQQFTPPAPAAPVYTPPASFTPYEAPKAKKKGHAGIIIVVIALLLILVVAVACVFLFKTKKDDNKDNTTNWVVQTTVEQTEPENTTITEETTAATVSQPSDQDVLNALNSLGITGWDGNYSSLTDAQKQALKDYYKGLGQDVEITDNGISFKTDNGTVDILGGKWPDSALIKDVPKPDFGKIFSNEVKATEVTVILTEVTEANFNDFIAKVKDAGFIKSAEEFNMYGTHSYSASNDSGIKISIAMTAVVGNMLTISVTSGS